MHSDARPLSFSGVSLHSLGSWGQYEVAKSGVHEARAPRNLGEGYHRVIGWGDSGLGASKVLTIFEVLQDPEYPWKLATK